MLEFKIRIGNHIVKLDSMISLNEWTMIFQESDGQWYRYDLSTCCENACISVCICENCLIYTKCEISNVTESMRNYHNDPSTN
jgi:hypothetical protein